MAFLFMNTTCYGSNIFSLPVTLNQGLAVYRIWLAKRFYLAHQARMKVVIQQLGEVYGQIGSAFSDGQVRRWGAHLLSER